MSCRAVSKKPLRKTLPTVPAFAGTGTGGLIRYSDAGPEADAGIAKLVTVTHTDKKQDFYIRKHQDFRGLTPLSGTTVQADFSHPHSDRPLFNNYQIDAFGHRGFYQREEGNMATSAST